MAYLKATIQNDAQNAMVVINCSKSGTSFGDADNIVIYKKSTAPNGDGADWFMVAKINVTKVDDLDFSYKDYMVRSGVPYDYHIDLRNGESIIEMINLSVVCQFRGVSIGCCDASGWTVFYSEYGTKSSGVKFDVKKNMDVQYVKTLKGRYPIRINNSDQNYYSGSYTGLYLPTDVCGTPTINGANDYKEMMMEFLCDGKEKLLRTGSGKAMIVSIDGNPSENWSEYDGLSTISFSWTQIGEFDVMEVDPENNPGILKNVR